MCSLPYPVPLLPASLRRTILPFFPQTPSLSMPRHSLLPLPLPAVGPSSSTHLPLGEPQVHLSSALSLQSLVLLQRAADDARSDGDVAVVAVPSAGSVSSRTFQESVALRAAGVEDSWAMEHT